MQLQLCLMTVIWRHQDYFFKGALFQVQRYPHKFMYLGVRLSNIVPVVEYGVIAVAQMEHTLALLGASQSEASGPRRRATLALPVLACPRPSQGPHLLIEFVSQTACTHKSLSSSRENTDM